MKKIKLPGLIDIHVHLRDPGQTEKEDFTTGTKAAIAGGFTTIIDMPNNAVPITTAARLKEKMSIAAKKTVGTIGFYFGSLGDNLDEFAEVSKDVFGLKLYLNHTTGGFIITPASMGRIYKAWAKVSSQPILLHSEEDMITTVLQTVRETSHPSHICHVSSRHELQQIIDAKNEGLPVTCGVCPHHLFLADSDIEKIGSYGRMKPPLKSKDDIDFMWSHLNDIDCIESDHAPHTKAEKDSSNPPFGVPGLETTLPLLMTAIHEKKIKINDVIRLCYDGPRRILHLPEDSKTYIEVDTETQYALAGAKMQSKCGWTPFEGKKVWGRVTKTVISGKVAYENGIIYAKAGSGSIIKPVE